MFEPSTATKKSIPSTDKVTEREKFSSKESKQRSLLSRPLLAFLLIVSVLGAYYLMAGIKKSPIVIDENGNATLAPHRQEKRAKEMEEIDNAVQYVLLAAVDGYFPCATCADGVGVIYLYKGEVWKYGVTRIGEKRRYPNGNYGALDVRYQVQFTGTYSECLKMEKMKIYDYPLLLEARKRDILLIIPLGNANDN